MFSFLKKRSSQGHEAPDSSAPETDPERMSLAERMAYRREMLYQSIRESLQQLQVVSSMYKFRVMNLDSRQHRFVAMIEVTNSFEARMDGMNVGFNQIEAFIKKRTQERFDVRLDAIFWRVNEVESSFVHSRRASDGPQAPSGGANPPRQRDATDGIPASRPRLSRGETLPGPLGAISVQHLDYESEHAPLEPLAPSGKTEYGQL